MKAGHLASLAQAPLSATIIIGLGTAASLAMSVVTTKVYALVVGPAGVGWSALMLGVLNVAALAGTIGLSTSVVQAVSAAATTAHRQAVARAARGLALVAMVAVAAGIMVLRESLAAWLFGDSSQSGYLLFLAPAAVLTGVAYVEVGILSGHHRVRAVSTVNVLTGVVGLIAGAAWVLAIGVPGIAPAILTTSAAHLVFAWLVNRNAFSMSPDQSPRRGPVLASLVALGVPVWLTQLAVIGVQLLVPVLILHSFGHREVGLYRAAATISTAYLAFFIAALTYDFLPRMAKLEPADIGASIDRHMRLLLGVALPPIVVLFALGPIVLEVLFSEDFVPATSILQWQLVGDMLRLPAWALAFAMVARARGTMYLAVELVPVLTLVFLAPIGLRIGGVEGVGIAYAIAQATYLLAAWVVMARMRVTTPGRLQAVVLAVAAAATAAIAFDVPLASRGLAFGALGVALAMVAIPRLYALHRSGEL